MPPPFFNNARQGDRDLSDFYRCVINIVGLKGGLNMPRQAREKSSTGIYHVMVRGINRQKVFIDDGDCIQFIKKIEEAKEKSDFEFYGYCLMGIYLLMIENMFVLMAKLNQKLPYYL